MSSTVKRGDTHTITLTVRDSENALVDLTGATVRLLALPTSGGEVIVLPSALGAGTGTVVHTLSGNLAAGTYSIEVEATIGGVITTAPTEGYATLTVTADLG